MGKYQDQGIKLVMSALRNVYLFTLAALVICLTPNLASATVIQPDQTYSFAGVCNDCTGSVTAKLILVGSYTRGSDLDPSDLVSFTYGGSDLLPSFTITQATVGGLFGNIPATLPGPADLFIYSGDGDFGSTGAGNPDRSGQWCAGIGCAADQGINGVWSAGGVPEPGSWALMMVGVFGLGAAMRVRRRTATALA